jgi:hypothetical protein
MNMTDPAVLRKRIADLESENKRLKESSETAPTIKGFNTMRAGGAPTSGVPVTQEKDWMNFGSQPLERPTTANSNNKVKEL